MKERILLALAATVGLACAGPEEGKSAGVPAFLDINGDGVLSEAERQAFEQARENGRGGVFDKWDSNHDGEIDDEERRKAVDHMRGLVNEQRRRLFESVAGADGVLTLEEAKENILPFGALPDQAAARLFGLLDADGNGEITEQEFLDKLNRGRPHGPPAPGSQP